MVELINANAPNTANEVSNQCTALCEQYRNAIAILPIEKEYVSILGDVDEKIETSAKRDNKIARYWRSVLAKMDKTQFLDKNAYDDDADILDVKKALLNSIEFRTKAAKAVREKRHFENGIGKNPVGKPHINRMLDKLILDLSDVLYNGGLTVRSSRANEIAQILKSQNLPLKTSGTIELQLRDSGR